MKISGGGTGHVGSQFISRYLELGGNGALNIDYDPNQAFPGESWGWSNNDAASTGQLRVIQATLPC